MAAKKESVDSKSASSARDDSGVVLTDEMRNLVKEGSAFLRAPLNSIHLFSELGKNKFRNSRKQQGFDPESMASLAKSIAKNGLIQNLVVREVVNPQDNRKTINAVITGERRLRAIRSLVEKNEKVYNRATKTFQYAAEVYATVPCLVEGDCSDEEALILNFIENDERTPLNAAETIDYFVYLESGLNLTRAEISDKTGKSQAWLSHLFNFEKKLDPQVYEDLRAGKISWSAAVRAMEYQTSDQVAILEHATAIATERRGIQLEKANERLDTAATALVQTQQEVAAARKKNDPRIEQLARNRQERAAKEVIKANEAKEQLETTPVSPTQSDIAEGAFNAGIDPHGNRNLTSAQIQNHYVAKVKGDLGDKKFAKDPKTGNKVSARDLRLVSATAAAIAVGKRDVFQVLREFYIDEGDWSKDGKAINDVSVPPVKTRAAVPAPEDDLISNAIREMDDDEEEEEDDMDALGEDLDDIDELD